MSDEVTVGHLVPEHTESCDLAGDANVDSCNVSATLPVRSDLARKIERGNLTLRYEGAAGNLSEGFRRCE